MHEHPQQTELASATSTGLLAEEMVFAIGRLLRERSRPEGEDAKAIEAGRVLLNSAVDPSLGVSQPGLSQLSQSEGTLDTIRAVLVQAPGEDVKNYVQRLDRALKRALEDSGEDFDAYEDDLIAVRDLFATVGHLTLSRANRLTRSPQEHLGWPISTATLNS
jgi:hypothetical protein